MVKEATHIDEHTHTDKEIGDEEGIAHKLDAVHQRRHTRNISIEHQTRKEGTEESLEPCQLRHGGTQHQQYKDKGKLRHIVAILLEKISRKSRVAEEDEEAI